MIRNSHNAGGSSTHTGNPLPRWRMVFIALMLALVIGSVGQIRPAQAAPPTTTIRYILIARNLKGDATVCVGDDVPIKVRVIRAEMTGNQGDNVQNISGVFIQATMSNPGIGNLHPVSMETGRGAFAPGEIDFTFRAEKEGATTITFKGQIEHIWGGSDAFLAIPKLFNKVPKWVNLIDRRDFVEAQVDIKVEKCDYKVTTVSKWEVPGEAHIKIDATINNAGLTDDGTGHYTGKGSVSWSITTSQVGDCKAQSVSTTSEAELSGERHEDELIVDVAFLPANISLPAYCVGKDGGIASGSTPVQLTPDPVTPTVSTSGGGERLTQVLQGPEPTSGYIVVVVTRVE